MLLVKKKDLPEKSLGFIRRKTQGTIPSFERRGKGR
jgi:hypothetical protein